MRIILLTLFTFLLSGIASADERAITENLNRLQLLQVKVSQHCLNNPNSQSVQIRIDGRNYRCPELITVTNLLREQVAEEVARHRENCEEENRRPQHNALAAQAATIAQRAAACPPSPDRQGCVGKFACGILSAVTFPVASLAARMSQSPTVRQCADQARGMPSCLANLMRGIFDSMWSMITLVWDLGRAGVTAAGEWLGLIRRSEATTSERAMMAQQAGPGFLSRLASDPAGTISKMASDLFEAVQESAMSHYGCEEWSGAPFVSNCLKPMTTWDCGTCQQKTQVFCGIAGYAAGEIGTAFLTGGLFSGAKIALTGAVKLGAGPSRTVAAFMGRTFPRASEEVAQAAGRVRNLAANGFTAAQNRLFDAWNALSNSQVTRAIATAARTTHVTTISRATLKPIGVYLSAMDNAFIAGAAAVDNVAAAVRGAAGARIADQAMGATASPGLTVEAPLAAQRGGRAVTPPTTQTTPGTPRTQNQTTPRVTQPASTGQQATPELPPPGNITTAMLQEDIARYKTDPLYGNLFRGDEVYEGQHLQLAIAIRTRNAALAQARANGVIPPLRNARSEAQFVRRYRADSEFNSLFSHPPLYPGYHADLAVEIRRMEAIRPPKTKTEIRQGIQQRIANHYFLPTPPTRAAGEAAAEVPRAGGVTPPSGPPRLTIEGTQPVRPGTINQAPPAAPGTTTPSPATAITPVRSGGATPAQVRRERNATRAAEEAQTAADIAKYRSDPDFAALFRGPELYQGHHQELSMVIKAMEQVQPRLTKEAIRVRIQQTLNSCQL